MSHIRIVCGGDKSLKGMNLNDGVDTTMHRNRKKDIERISRMEEGNHQEEHDNDTRTERRIQFLCSDDHSSGMFSSAPSLCEGNWTSPGL